MRIFLSFLAGKIKIFKQMLTTWQMLYFFFFKWRMRILGARIFLSLLAGKLKRFEQVTYSNCEQQFNKDFTKE